MAKFTLLVAAGFLLMVGLLLGSAPAFALSGALVSSTISSANIQPGGVATVTVTISNPNSTTLDIIGNLTTLPSGVAFASANHLSSNCLASPTFGTNSKGIYSPSFGDLTFELLGNTSCTYQVDVTAPSVGTFDIHTNYANTTVNSSVAGQNFADLTLVVGTTPVVTSLSATNGLVAGGTPVIISGLNFDPTPANDTVMFGANSVTVTAASTTSLTVTSPAHAVGGVNVTVQNSGGTSAFSNADVFTYYTTPQICPTQTASLAINGLFTTTDLSANCNDSGGAGLYLNAVDAVGFNNQIASNSSNNFSGAPQTVTTTNATYSFQWTEGAALGGITDKYIIKLLSVGSPTSPNVTSSSNLNGAGGTDSFTLYDDNNVPLAQPVPFAITIPGLPTVTSIAPVSGTTAGGTNVTITGTNFTGATGVTIGGAAATNIIVVNSTTITGKTPAGTVGTASVVVTTAVGPNVANTLYTYIAPPTVTSISPVSGTTAGGTAVTITGTNFTGATGVTVGGAAATNIIVVNSTSITATTPAGTVGTASVVVTTAVGSNVGNTLYTYTTPPLVTTNPSSQTVTAGGVASFTAAASGSPTPTVQWQASTDGGVTFSNIPAPMSSPLVFTAQLAQNNNQYRAVFTNAAGSVTTSAATLTVNPVAPPIVTQNFTPATIVLGQTSQLNITLSNPNPSGIGLSQLSFNDALPAGLQLGIIPPTDTCVANLGISGGNLSFNTGTLAGGASCTISVSVSDSQTPGAFNSGPFAVSSAEAPAAQVAVATLTVTAPPLVTTNPTSVTVVVGQTATFTAAASGSPTPSVQWQQSTDGGATFSAIAGATSASYAFTTAASESGYQYRAVFTNAAGSVTTSAATLTVALISQTISFPVVGVKTFTPAGTFNLAATGGASGNAVTFASTTTGVCTVAGSTVSMVSVGTCTVAADQLGNANYTAAPQVSQNITINKAAQTITFPVIPAQTYTPAGTFSVSATGGASGNAVTFASMTTGVCTVSGSTVSMVSAGTCTITANQLGNVS